MMRTLKDYEHLRPKAGEPALLIRDAIKEDGRSMGVCLLPEGTTLGAAVFIGGAAPAPEAP